MSWQGKRVLVTGAAGGLGERSFVESVARDIAALIAGFNQELE